MAFRAYQANYFSGSREVGSEAEVPGGGTHDTSAPVREAVDVGRSDATAWLSEHGAESALQISATNPGTTNCFRDQGCRTCTPTQRTSTNAAVAQPRAGDAATAQLREADYPALVSTVAWASVRNAPLARTPSEVRLSRKAQEKIEALPRGLTRRDRRIDRICRGAAQICISGVCWTSRSRAGQRGDEPGGKPSRRSFPLDRAPRPSR